MVVTQVLEQRDLTDRLCMVKETQKARAAGKGIRVREWKKHLIKHGLERGEAWLTVEGTPSSTSKRAIFFKATVVWVTTSVALYLFIYFLNGSQWEAARGRSSRDRAFGKPR